jgi:glycerophosphoryl diester phosphodiesterase
LHDPSLDRTTTGKGYAKDKTHDDIKDIRLAKKRKFEPIPVRLAPSRALDAPEGPPQTFENLIDFLMLPENRHLTFNIDCKPSP